MSHINYFEPYDNKGGNHEDQLTRAFLVVLRYCPLALLKFYDAVIDTVQQEAYRIEVSRPNLLSASKLPLDDVYFDTQRSSLPENVTQVISVLLTDQRLQLQGAVESSNRGARYDGLIGFSQGTCLVIENKPRHWHVWAEQLNPNLSNRDDQPIELVRAPAVIEWKAMLAMLTSLLDARAVTGAEALLISDFLDYVEHHYGFLMPYDRLHLCKRNKELLERRIMQLMRSICTESTVIRKHPGYAPVIETGSHEMRMITIRVGLDTTTQREALHLVFYFCEAQNGARAFYRRAIPYSVIDDLKRNKGWEFEPNFHLNFVSTGLVWIGTDIANDQKYYDYWLQNASSLRQVAKVDLMPYLNDLGKRGLIVFDEEAQRKVNDEFINTNRGSANICPGFGLYRKMDLEKAEALDRTEGALADWLRDEIKICMTAMQQPANFLRP